MTRTVFNLAVYTFKFIKRGALYAPFLLPSCMHLTFEPVANYSNLQ
ncbi:hypothetical protein [Legionella shakespearei]|nr:hypothetical protein [Legionella shakespearei]